MESQLFIRKPDGKYARAYTSDEVIEVLQKRSEKVIDYIDKCLESLPPYIQDCSIYKEYVEDTFNYIKFILSGEEDD